MIAVLDTSVVLAAIFFRTETEELPTISFAGTLSV